MNVSNSTMLVILGVSAALATAWAGRHFFSAEARRERRRRRSNARVSSTARRPMVKFNVRSKGRKKD